MGNIIHVDIAVIGSGIVGLCVARALLHINRNLSLTLVERHSKFGQETSSRNSEVIHAGIYYPQESLKAKTCIRGKELLYNYLQKNNINYRQCGKLIIAGTPSEEQKMLNLYNSGKAQGVSLMLYDKVEIFKKAGLNNLFGAIWSPTSGIFDTHDLMRTVESEVIATGGVVSYSTTVKSIELMHNKLAIACESHGERFFLVPNIVINCSGLNAGKIHKLFFPQSNYKIIPCRGHYYLLNNNYKNKFNTLIYPIPTGDGGLGVHITIDCDGYLKLGPDVDWSSSEEGIDTPDLLNFKIDQFRKIKFFNEGLKYIPELRLDDLTEGYVGLRPKLLLNDVFQNDFVVEAYELESTKVISLLGIESPGLTAAMGIADYLCNHLI